MLDVSIITVNYYSIDEIIECYKSITEFTPEYISYELIVVSNSLDSVSNINRIKSEFKDLTYIQSDKNIGFGKANNLGVKASKGKYLFFLNPDTKLLNDCIGKLKMFLEKNSDVGIVGPSVYSDNNSIQPSIANFPSLITMLTFILPFSHLYLPKKYISNNYFLEKTCVVPTVQGSSIFISANLFNKVSGFTKDYFMYSEETDLCKKIYLMGKKTAYLYSAKILHIGGTTTSSNFNALEIEKHRSRKKYLILHNPNLLLINRILYAIGYFYRVILFFIILKKEKALNFSRLLRWYIFKYR